MRLHVASRKRKSARRIIVGATAWGKRILAEFLGTIAYIYGNFMYNYMRICRDIGGSWAGLVVEGPDT